AGRQQHAIAGDEPSGLGECTVTRDEIGTRQTIAVKKDAIVATTREDGAIADFCSTKSGIRLPDMADRDTDARMPAPDHGPSLRPGYPACSGQMGSWSRIPAAQTVPPRSRKSSARGSCRFRFTASATCATAPSRNAGTNGFSAWMQTSAARHKCGTKFFHWWS